jgi:hypothetical protein
VARAAMLKALHSTHMQELSPLHWCCYVDGHGINLDGEWNTQLVYGTRTAGDRQRLIN